MSGTFEAYSNYYDLVYRTKDYRQEAEHVVDLIRRHERRNVQSIFEMGCGTGRHALEIEKLGYEISGIDLSAEMVKRAQAQGSIPSRFNVGDVRTYRSGRTYDCAVSLFHVASYQTANSDISSYLDTAALHLDPDGLFIFDFWYSPAVLSIRPERRVKRIESDILTVYRYAEPEIDYNANTVAVNYTLIIIDKATSRVEVINESHLMRHFSMPEMEGLLSQRRLELVHAEDFPSGDPPSETTWAICLVCRKRG
jgi:SAM-dependent methyltransferase